MNSFRSVERAIAFEIERQAAALDAGEPLTMETRGWDDGRQATYHMRPKEQSDDYRYFPEPDLPPLHIDSAWLAAIRDALPGAAGSPPGAVPRRPRAVGLRRRGHRQRPDDVGRVRGDPRRRARPAGKEIANLVTGEYGRHAREIAESRRDGARRAWPMPRRWPTSSGRSPAARSRGPTPARCSRSTCAPAGSTREIIAREGFAQISRHGGADAAVDAALAANPAAVADYRAGKAQAIGFLVGQVMKATRGQANAAMVAGGAAPAPRRGRRAERERDLNLVLWAARHRADRVWAIIRARGPVRALPGAQGAGRQRRPLRGVARRRPRHVARPARRWRCRCSPAGADRGRDRARRLRARVPRLRAPVEAADT